LATSRPTGCSQTRRAAIFSGAFTRVMLSSSNLAILGGCCETDECYIEALAKAAVDHGESTA
jgi:hypothetical protein